MLSNKSKIRSLQRAKCTSKSALGQERFNSLIIIRVTCRYGKDTIWTNTSKDRTAHTDTAFPRQVCPGSALPATFLELLQEETSEGKDWQSWPNACLCSVTSDFVQLGERAELSVSHMDMGNSSLAILQGRQITNTCWIMNLLSQQISHDQQVFFFPADSGTLRDFWSFSSAIFFL